MSMQKLGNYAKKVASMSGVLSKKGYRIISFSESAFEDSEEDILLANKKLEEKKKDALKLKKMNM